MPAAAANPGGAERGRTNSDPGPNYRHQRPDPICELRPDHICELRSNAGPNRRSVDRDANRHRADLLAVIYTDHCVTNAHARAVPGADHTRADPGPYPANVRSHRGHSCSDALDGSSDAGPNRAPVVSSVVGSIVGAVDLPNRGPNRDPDGCERRWRGRHAPA